MEVTKENLERLLELIEFVTPGPWVEEATEDGAQICTMWKKECDCNKACMMDCRCEDTTLSREVICEFTERSMFDVPRVDRSILDAEFVCMVRNFFPKLVKAHLKFMEESK